MRTLWYVLAKRENGRTLFLSREDSITGGATTERPEDAETFAGSDAMRDTARELGYFPVPADFFGIEV